MAFDTIIRSGTVATASDTFRCDIGISGGRIAALGDNLGEAGEIVDASGRLALPGGIDSHVHIAQPSGPGIVMADDFSSATRSAAFGGNTMVLPFAMQQKGESLREVVKQYHAKADGQCYVDVSFHLIIADATERVLGQELPALVEDGYTSSKVFMTYEGLALSDLEMLNVMSVARETGALVMVHAENYDAIRFLTDRLERAGKTAPQYHATSRPIPVEREATHRRRADHDRSRRQPRGHGRDPPRPATRPEDLRRDLPAISGADRKGPRRPQHGGAQVRLLATAARQGEPDRLLGGPAAGRDLAVLVGSLSVPLR
jgi:dihydropyrimidinase